MDFAVLADHRVKWKESKNRDKYLNLARELKSMEHKSDGDTNCNWHAQFSHQKISTEMGWLGNKRTSEDYPNYTIIKISQNTEKSPGNLKRFAVSKTPVRNHQLMMVWKTLKRVK